ncbi:hypothetical protein GCM10023340_23620 [Nocardioides marinquilinus]|uniref:Uncharacterized protein n=1 Tax=Nocardioides marinquilinus TaxID=1210400 RepID=A0ABP9PPW9_9ACTN
MLVEGPGDCGTAGFASFGCDVDDVAAVAPGNAAGHHRPARGSRTGRPVQASPTRQQMRGPVARVMHPVPGAPAGRPARGGACPRKSRPKRSKYLTTARRRAGSDVPESEC